MRFPGTGTTPIKGEGDHILANILWGGWRGKRVSQNNAFYS
jgi:hypothetical protein